MDPRQRDFLLTPCSTGSPQSQYGTPSSYLEENLPPLRSAPKPGPLSVRTTSSTLAAQIPYVVPFDRLLSCNSKFSDVRAPSNSLGSASIPVRTVHNPPDPDIRQGTYQQTGITAPACAPFRPSTRRSVHSPVCATVASSSVFTTEKNTTISQVYQGLSPPIMPTTPYHSGQTTGDMNTAYTPFGPVYPSHATHFLTPKDVQPAPALQLLDRHGYEPARLPPMPPPAAQKKTRAVRRPTRKIQSCNRSGCTYQSALPGDVSRHYTYRCELRDEAERNYANLLTTCYLCTTRRKPYSRPDVLRKHIRQKHSNATLPKGQGKKCTPSMVDLRKFYASSY
ncbi:hypothetical protein PILCRDRAFT_826850 [Piloderma croceum F 1598]|uniref:Uncharacterized protein n=1 Tax=Piloderma croceum (strain F 1598) TaxID=765440 RepID=A0A0C3APZ6_PILCF|nr:hypothetical protein PILCRDRAFT_826850 [Piloderma croceum F 1598]